MMSSIANISIPIIIIGNMIRMSFTFASATIFMKKKMMRIMMMMMMMMMVVLKLTVKAY